MRAATHISFSILSLGLLSGIAHCPFSLGNVLAASISSILPDIDTKQSTIGKVLFLISKPLEQKFGHRSITHSFLGYFLFSAFCLPLFFIQKTWFIAALIGYFSHLVIDCLNKTGTPFLYPNEIYAVFPANPRWRIKVGSMAEYILCALIILLASGIWYLNGIGIRSWFSSLLATPKMAVTEYRNHSNTHLMNVRVTGFYTMTQEPIKNERFKIIDALDDSTLLVEGKEGYLITIGDGTSNTIQTKRAVIEKVRPVKVETDTYHFYGAKIEQVLPKLSKDSYVSGTVDAFTRPRYIKMDMRPFKSGEFESIKISPGLSEFETRIEFKDASLEQLKRLKDWGISGDLVSRKVI